MARIDLGAAEMAQMAPAGLDGLACFELGCMYAAGRRVELDLVTAHKWFNIAASRGNPDAAGRRRELATEMSAGDVAIAQREARLWLGRH